MTETHPLREYRERNGLTLEALAGKLGCTIAALSRWELGQRTPRDRQLKKIIEVTGIPVAKIMGITEPIE